MAVRPADSRTQSAQERARMEFRASTLLKTITDELYAADFFTREDLLHTSAFLHVSTISRYYLVCRSVRWLIRNRQLTELSRTDLRLAGKNAKYPGSVFFEDYLDTIRNTLGRFKQKQTFTVMDVVQGWKSDPHLTTNNKRVAVRKSLTRLANQDVIDKVNEFEYQRK